MDGQDLKRMLTGIGIAGLIAGASLLTTGCAVKQVSSGCGGGSGCGGSMQQAAPDDSTQQSSQDSGGSAK
jgi:radical SAM modification target selenobiotic family peptide